MSTLRTLIAVSFLFAATGCAADPCDDETPEEHAAHTEEEAKAAEVEAAKLAIQKKAQITRKPQERN